MARAGFFATMQRAARAAERENQRQARHAVQLHAASVRLVEQTRKIEARLRGQLAKADAADRKRLEKEAKEAHLAARWAEADEQNKQLDETHEDIDTLLEATLDRDDYVDLQALRITATHPPFEGTKLEKKTPYPTPIPDPPEPVLSLPEPPRGLAGLFGKKKHQEAVAEAERQHERALAEWKNDCQGAEARRQRAVSSHASAEARRLKQLDAERARYAAQCQARDSEAEKRNRELDELIANVGYGTTGAIQEYVSIVLSNSVYPEHFRVSHEFEFEQTSAELRLRVLIPEPKEIPEIKSYKYSKSSDEIAPTHFSQKECRERYASAVHQVALRSLHEVFESDRRGLIQTISLEVGTNTTDPATGQPTYVPFVIAAADRATFLSFDLSAVVPAMTLGRLGAAMSKNPHGLSSADRAGVRRA
jgi:restriction system protein